MFDVCMLDKIDFGDFILLIERNETYKFVLNISGFAIRIFLLSSKFYW